MDAWMEKALDAVAENLLISRSNLNMRGVAAEGMSQIGAFLRISIPDVANKINTATPLARERAWARLRRWIWEQVSSSSKNISIEIKTTDWDAALSQPIPSFQRRSDELLNFFAEVSEELGEIIPIQSSSNWYGYIYAMTMARGASDVAYFLAYLKESGYIVADCGKPYTSMQARMLPAGYVYLETKAMHSSQSEQAFVAMWFPDKNTNPVDYALMEEIYITAISPAVERAGYRAYCVKNDLQTRDLINDRIVSEIRRSRFLIADFSCEKDKPRGGVYFEAGFAKGLNMPVIWMAREQSFSDVHFDTNHYPYIFWKTAAELSTALEERIVANIGQGPLPPP